jgi:hypothetical protein
MQGYLVPVPCLPPGTRAQFRYLNFKEGNFGR